MKARARIRAEELNALLELVGGEYNVTPKDLLGRSRTQPLSEARQCAMAFLRGRGHTFHAIGEKFGRDHGTVVHACAAIKGKAEVRTDLKERIQRIRLCFPCDLGGCSKAASDIPSQPLQLLPDIDCGRTHAPAKPLNGILDFYTVLRYSICKRGQRVVLG